MEVVLRVPQDHREGHARDGLARGRRDASGHEDCVAQVEGGPRLRGADVHLALRRDDLQGEGGLVVVLVDLGERLRGVGHHEERVVPGRLAGHRHLQGQVLAGGHGEVLAQVQEVLGLHGIQVEGHLDVVGVAVAHVVDHHGDRGCLSLNHDGRVVVRRPDLQVRLRADIRGHRRLVVAGVEVRVAGGVVQGDDPDHQGVGARGGGGPGKEDRGGAVAGNRRRREAHVVPVVVELHQGARGGPAA